MDALLVVAVCLFVGVVLRRVPSFPSAHAVPVLNAYAIDVALPALVVRQIAGLHPGGDLLVPVLVPWLLLGLSAAAVLALARARGWPRAVTGALLMVVPLGNTAFIGLPLVGAFLGPSALPFAILYDQLGSFLGLTLYGSIVVAAYSGATRPRPAAIARRILLFPPFVALLVGLLLGLVLPAGLPPLVATTLDRIGASLVPTVLVAVGIGWRFALPHGRREPFALALALKLALLPALAFALTRALGATGVAGDATILQAAMGPMITAGALATAAGLAPELVAAILGWGTFASLGTVALVHLLLAG